MYGRSGEHTYPSQYLALRAVQKERPRVAKAFLRLGPVPPLELLDRREPVGRGPPEEGSPVLEEIAVELPVHGARGILGHQLSPTTTRLRLMPAVCPTRRAGKPSARPQFRPRSNVNPNRGSDNCNQHDELASRRQWLAVLIVLALRVHPGSGAGP